MGNCLSRFCWGAPDDEEHEPTSSKSLHTPPRSEKSHHSPQVEAPLLANECGHDAATCEGTGNVQRRRTTVASPGTSRGGGHRSSGSAGKSLKDYELLAFLGQGSFAEVTLARQKSTRELFAVKKISKRKVREEGSVERAFTERHILASLRHPFLVRLHQAFQSSTHLYLVLQFAHGGDFRTFLQGYQKRGATTTTLTASSDTSDSAMIKSQGSTTTPLQNASNASSKTAAASSTPPTGLPLDLIYFYAMEVAIALLFLHQKGFVYRDLKPENILMQRDGHIMLTDFGVAKHHTPIVDAAVQQAGATAAAATALPPPGPSAKQRTRRSSFVGTRQYMSPEVLQGNPHDCKTDWWSFGCWVYEMFAGHGLFDGARTEYQLFAAIVEAPVALHLPDAQDVVLTLRHPPVEPLEAGEAERYTQQAAAALGDLLRGLLVRDAKQRLGGLAVLQHPFFRLPCWERLFERHSTPMGDTAATANNVGGSGASGGNNSYGSVGHSGAAATADASAMVHDVLDTMCIASPSACGAGDEAATARALSDNVQQFLCKCVASPYVPRLRGNEDLRCFPCAMSCNATCRIVNNSSVSTAAAASFGSASPAVQPSDELFEFMLHIEGEPSSSTAVQPTNSIGDGDGGAAKGSASDNITAYYDDTARPSDAVDVHGDDGPVAAVGSSPRITVPSTDGDAAPVAPPDRVAVPGRASGSDTTAPSSPALVGVSYVVDPPDSPQEDGMMDASMSYGATAGGMGGGHNNGFDGYSVMFMRGDSRHPSSSQLRSADGGAYAMWSHRVEPGEGFLPASNERMSSGGGSPTSGGSRSHEAFGGRRASAAPPPQPNAFANFTYQEGAPSFLAN